MEKIKLNVLGLSYNHSNSGAYALVLAEEEGERRIPIIIGGVEAQAIAIQLEGLTPPRPLTHDLFVSFATAFNIKVEEVFIYKLKDGIFYSELSCFDYTTKNKVRIDSRTSDAVALALRFHVPIYTSKEIIERAGIILDIENSSSPKPEETESTLNDLINSPEDTGSIDFTEFTMEELKKELQNAVGNEDYELASKIRDEIKRRGK
ncbi:bifunctional nuclease domain-containing protein [Saccharicrinis sp. FJH54]|uniref:bifunctional nuclease domain-containing protein n=1 Tax=Saccharicrinis sp. FJH54 TaxID=3344665 RepID=UPI0035D4AB59